MRNTVVFVLVFLSLNTYSQSSIVGGYQVDIQDAPYMVSIELNSNNSHFCGGSILSERWILTATHCVNNYTAADISVHAGSTNQTDNNNGQVIQVQTIYLHPSYTTDPDEHDIALLYLSQPLMFNQRVQPIQYANSCNSSALDISPNPNITSFLTGWGLLTAGGTHPANLRGVDMPIISNTLAEAINTSHHSSNNFGITSNMISYWRIGKGASKGDSGGPSVLDKNGGKVQIGITSWGYQPWDQLPSIYTNIRQYETWIETTMGYSINPSTQDLYVKSRPWDMGFTPFNDIYPWNTEDMWIRRNNDGIEKHQNPEYSSSANVFNYVNIKVRNRGCLASQGNEVLKLYWTKGGTGISWPDHWNGTRQTSTGDPLGGVVGQVTLPVIQPGDSYVAVIPYQPANPANYTSLWTNPLFAGFAHQFCLLTRIVATSDPMTTIETSDVIANTQGNNNIAWRNITVVDIEADGDVSGESYIAGGSVLVGDISRSGGTYDLEFHDYLYSDNSITSEAEITVTLDDDIWDDWESNGFPGSGIGAIDDENHQVVISSSPGVISGLSFSADELKMIHVNFNMLADNYTQKEEFEYQVIQKQSSNGDVIGGEVYKIIVPMRPLFDADAGIDEDIYKGDSTLLSASEIPETAIFNWYDENDDLIGSDREIWVSPESSKEYTLEVIATSDGFKDYDGVFIGVKADYFVSATPNPVSDELEIEYLVDDGSSASILLVNSQQANTYYQNSIDPNLSNTTIDVSNYSSGLYYMILQVDGANKDQIQISVQ